jgi:hypothetical protein
MANKKFSAFSSGADATSASRIVGYTNSTTNNNQWTPEELAAGLQEHLPESFIIACSDETTALTTGTNKAVFRMPYAFTVTAVRASLTTAGTGANLVTVDINEDTTAGGVTPVSILTTPITIDATEKTSTTAATQPVIGGAGPDLANDAQITIDIDQIDSGGVSAGLKVTIIGYQS